jgi:hypothetical protein
VAVVCVVDLGGDSCHSETINPLVKNSLINLFLEYISVQNPRSLLNSTHTIINPNLKPAAIQRHPPKHTYRAPSLHPSTPPSRPLPITALHPRSRLLGSSTTTTALTLQFVVFFVPPPHFGVALHFLLLPLPRAVDAQSAVGFDDAAEGHAGHLEESGEIVKLFDHWACTYISLEGV